jgi:CrcB protein
MSFPAVIWIALGGAAGSVLRGAMQLAIPAGRMQWATLVVNLIGSFGIGWLMARVGSESALVQGRLYPFGVVGFCGGFTTFSAFSWQVIQQMQRGSWGWAVAQILVSVSGCLIATWVGWRLGR